MDFVYVATLGRTDLQVIVPSAEVLSPHDLQLDDGQLEARYRKFVKGIPVAQGETFAVSLRGVSEFRVPVKVSRTRDFHNFAIQLQDLNPDQAHVHVRISDSDRIPRLLSDVWIEEGSEQGPKLVSKPDREQLDCLDIEITHGIRLCAPIRDASLRRIKDLQEEGRLGACTAILLMITNRDGRRDEPFAVGELIKNSLTQELTVNGQVPEVEICEFLTEGELYDQNSVGVEHLANSPAINIDRAIKEIAQHAGNCAVCTTGGIPGTKSFVTHSCQNHFQDLWDVSGNDRSDQTETVTYFYAKSIQDKGVVLSLIEKGAISAASSLASNVVRRRQLREEPWREWLVAVADALQGDASGLEIEGGVDSQMLQEMNQIKTHGVTLIAGLRVELFLRSQQWVSALIATKVFHETARNELIDRHLKKNSLSTCFTLDGRSLSLSKLQPDRLGQLLAAAAARPDYFISINEEKRDEFRDSLPDSIANRTDGNDVEIDPSFFGGIDLSDWNIPYHCCFLPLRDWWQYEAVQSLLPEQSQESVTEFFSAYKEGLQDFRNKCMHHTLEGQDIQRMRENASNVGLWFENPKYKFLSGDLFLSLIQQLNGEDFNPRDLLDDLLAGIKTDILNV